MTAAHGCAIEYNRVENAFFGIYLANVTDCRVANNVLHASGKRETESGNGIHLWTSRRITIDSNQVSGHRDGIYFEFVHESDIRGNVSRDNLRYGLHFMYSDDCRYVKNVFQHNGSGVAVMYTKRVLMVGNRFEDNWGPCRLWLAAQGDQRPAARGQRVLAQHDRPSRRRRESVDRRAQRLRRQPSRPTAARRPRRLLATTGTAIAATT